MPVNLTSKFPQNKINTQDKLRICTGNPGVGVGRMVNYSIHKFVFRMSRGLVGILLEVDHLDIKGFQVNNRKDSWLRD